jgi:CBS domain-containing protein
METILLETTIRQAAKMVLESRCRTVFVVSENNHLLGVVTEGDLIRAYLEGANPEAGVRHVMNENPIFASPGSTTKDLDFLMKKFGQSAIPILDERRVLVSVFRQID